MKKTILALAVVLTTVGTIYVTAQSSNVIICHTVIVRGRGQRTGMTLSVSPNQLAAHLQHGDKLDSCVVNP